MDSYEKQIVEKEFSTKKEGQKLDFHTEIDLFLINSPLDKEKRDKVRDFVTQAYFMGRNSKL